MISPEVQEDLSNQNYKILAGIHQESSLDAADISKDLIISYLRAVH